MNGWKKLNITEKVNLSQTNLSVLSMTNEHGTIKRKFMQGKMQGPINI